MNEVSLIQASIEQLERVSRSMASIGETEDYTEVAINALEKQMPKKPIFNHNLSDTPSVFRCECGNTIKVSHDIGIMDNNNAPNYCSKCGCKFDWSDEE